MPRLLVYVALENAASHIPLTYWAKKEVKNLREF